MKFSVITASYNPGNKIEKTIHSVLAQTCQDYEILIKDGQSDDGSIEQLIQLPEVAKENASGRIRLLVQPDGGVYDGMNQAIAQAHGEFLIFLNCGDTFHDENVLQKTLDYASQHPDDRTILYGDTYCEQTGQTDQAAPVIDGFACYRNIPCHQSCFYARRLFEEKQYDTTLKIRADYDHFLWCVYERHVVPVRMGFTVSDYEGGGISENNSNAELDKQEHETVIRRYMTPQDIASYKRLMVLTLAPLRKKIAENRQLAGVYQKLKTAIYRRK